MLGDFYAFCIAVIPLKTDSILIVNPYAVLALPVAFQLLQTVTGSVEVSQIGCIVQHLQLAFGNLRPTLAFSHMPELRGRGIGKGLNHDLQFNERR